MTLDYKIKETETKLHLKRKQFYEVCIESNNHEDRVKVSKEFIQLVDKLGSYYCKKYNIRLNRGKQLTDYVVNKLYRK